MPSKKKPKTSAVRSIQEDTGIIPAEMIVRDIEPVISCRLAETSRHRRFLETTGFSKRLGPRDLD